jgi:hypothetical protein
MTVQDVRSTKARDAERAKLRRELSRLDTIFFLISAMVVVDTIVAGRVGRGRPVGGPLGGRLPAPSST